MDENDLKKIVEALLFSAGQALSLEKIQNVFIEEPKPTKAELKSAIQSLKEEYHARSFELVEGMSGYQIHTRIQYSMWIARMQVEKPTKYSRALLETLAIIAYKQPVTRADIEEIRGVAVTSQIIKSLIEREWIRIAGFKDVVGKPAVYVTTKEFLNYFNLQTINGLPELYDAVQLNEDIL